MGSLWTAVVFAGGWAAPAAPSAPSFEPPALRAAAAKVPPSAVSAPTRPPPPPLAVPAPSDDLVDTVLPCGLRLVAARDPTLPVAAVVLAVEFGTDLDATEGTGSAAALAELVLSGTRRLPPQAWGRLAHQVGGVATMVQSARQTRFEVVVPAADLEAALTVGALALWRVTVDPRTVRHAARAARTRPRGRASPAADPALRAALFGIPADKDPEKRRDLPPEDPRWEEILRRGLETWARPDRATLVVVGPTEPSAVLEAVERRTADLPPRRRGNLAAAPAARTADTELPAASAPAVAAALPPGHRPLLLARIVCRAVNRFVPPRGARRPRLACHLGDDPRRGTLVIQAPGAARSSAVEAVERNLATLFDTTAGRRQIDRQRRVVRDRVGAEAATAVGLARILADRSPDSPPAADIEDAAALRLLRDPVGTRVAARRLVEGLRFRALPLRIVPGRGRGSRDRRASKSRPSHKNSPKPAPTKGKRGRGSKPHLREAGR